MERAPSEHINLLFQHHGKPKINIQKVETVSWDNLQILCRYIYSIFVTMQTFPILNKPIHGNKLSLYYYNTICYSVMIIMITSSLFSLLQHFLPARIFCFYYPRVGYFLNNDFLRSLTGRKLNRRGVLTSSFSVISICYIKITFTPD